jgi:hypothetical protein
MNRKNSFRAVNMAMPFLVAMLAAVAVGATARAADAAAAPPKGIAGSWQGALDANGMTLRLVLDVTETDGRLSAVLTSVDQGNVKIPVTSIGTDTAGAHFEVTAISGSFEGKYSTDGNEISGTWKQGPVSLPLTFKRQPQP